MWSRIALYKYSRYQWFNLWLPLEATSTTCLNWLSCTLLAALHAHRIEIPYWAFPEQVGPQILSLESVDYFGRSDYFSGWKKEQSLSAKLWGLYWKTRIEDWGLRIGDWGLGIGDWGSGIPKKERKIWTLLYYIKNLTQTISSFISLTTIPFFLNPFMFYLLLWPLHFHSFWWVFVLLQL